MGLTAIAIACLAVSLIGAVSACMAAYFGWKAQFEQNRARPEEHTAASPRYLNAQAAKDEPDPKADPGLEQMALSLWGQDPENCPLRINLICEAPEAMITRLGLYNEQGAFFGAAICLRGQDGAFWTEIDPAMLQRWYQGGTRVTIGEGHSRVILRIYLAVEGRETSRRVVANLSQRMVEHEAQRQMIYHLENLN